MREYTNQTHCSPLNNEKGIVLITALLITLLLTIVVIALSYRVGLFSAGTRDLVIKSQNLYTAELGLNQARYFMMANDCLPPNWNACLPGINKNSFTNISSNIKSVFSTSMPEISVGSEKFNLNLAGVLAHGTNDTSNYKVYVKETNIPKVVNVIAVAEKPENEMVKTVIDAGLIYTTPLGSGYKQMGQSGTREGISGESLGADAANARANF